MTYSRNQNLKFFEENQLLALNKKQLTKFSNTYFCEIAFKC